MSRSYKHTPISKDGDRRKKPFKQIANRRVRRMFKNPDFEIRQKSNDHRQLTESWEIADYVSRWSKEDAIKEYYDTKHKIENNIGWRAKYHDDFLERFPTLESWLSFWKKCVLRK